MKPTSHEEFVSEPITPVRGSSAASAMARGEPGLPRRFTWRDTEYRVTGVVRSWKTSGPCRNGSREVYLRRHWHRVVTDPPAVMTLYCERTPFDVRRPKGRWYLYTLEPLDAPPPAGA